MSAPDVAPTISHVHPSELREAPENPREITAERLAALKFSLEADPDMLEARPIIADVDTGEVVCGNMRLRAAKELGWTNIPVYLKSFSSAAERREWMLRDNQEYGNWVPDELAALVITHRDEGSDLRLLGFADQELKDLLSLSDPDPDLPLTGDAPDDEVPVVYGIVIDCEDEDQQVALLEEFNEKGLNARALMV